MNKKTKALLKENNELEKKLTKETNDILTDIVVYIRGANINEYNQELVRRDITNMLIDGEARGESAKEIIGNDFKAFCDLVIAEVPQMTRGERMVNIIQTLCLCMGILLGIWTLSSVIENLLLNVSLLYIELTLGDIITASLIIIVSIFIVELVCRRAFDFDGVKPWVFVVLFAITAAVVVLPSMLAIKTIGMVSSIISAVIAVLLLSVYKVIDIM